MKRNVTITLDEHTARWARVEAARRDTSVSDFVGSLLRERTQHDLAYERAMAAWLALKPVALKRSGRCPGREAAHMSAVFVDTNVLVYARDASERRKQPRAAEWLARLWQERRGRLSTQVLRKYYVVVTGKLTPGLPAAVARNDVRLLQAWDPVAVDGALLESAWEIRDRYQLSFWNAQIVAAAQRCQAAYLLSEDMQDGQELGGVRVVDPFAHQPATLD